MKREYQFNKLLRLFLVGFGFHFYRVENHAIEPGMPDLHFVTEDGLNGWIEVKDEQGHLPSRIKYEKGQVPWLVEYDKLGGFCCTIVRMEQCKTPVMGVIAAKDSPIAETHLRDVAVALYEFDQYGWQGLAELLKDGARRSLWKQYGMIPAHPGQYVRESMEQDLIGGIARQRRSL